MSLQSRREALRTAVLSALPVALGGCSARLGSAPTSTATSSPTAPRSPTDSPPRTTSRTPPTTSATGPIDSREGIAIVFHGESSTEELVHYTVTGEDTVLSDGEVRVPSGEVATVESDIVGEGTYELAVTLDGGLEESTSFSIGEYALREGSNLVVWIHAGRVEFAIEE